MPIISPIRSRVAALASAALGLSIGGTVHAGPITGSGQPVATEQPSLAVTYLIRTQGSNFGDIGQVEMYAGGNVPQGFAVANGQLLSIASNPALFSRIGTTYGGDGRATFALPDLTGRMVVGTGNGPALTPRNLGSVAGAPIQSLNATQLPAFGGANGVTKGGVPLPTVQPSIALNQSFVLQGGFPTPNAAQAQAPLIGQVLTFAGSPPSSSQLPADGRQVAITQNTAAFAVIGNTYGGSSPNTFALPDLRGRAATEVGSGPGLIPQALGDATGAESTVLSLANLPPQSLTLPNGNKALLGGGLPFSIQAPTLGLHYIIAEQGLYPIGTGIIPDGVPFLGEISLFAGTFAPSGWAFADGQLLSISQFTALFSLLGTTYGGNGFSNFALPDLRDRVAVGAGPGFTLGETFGADNETLTFAQLPPGYPAVLPGTNVPEPSGLALLLTGVSGLLCRRSRRDGGTTRRFAAETQ